MEIQPTKAQEDKDKLNKELESESWCFVCKDGGNLRICDQTGCLKVYHRKCVGAKKGFLESEELWICRKHCCALCFTESEMSFSCLCCTYALCDRCCSTTSGPDQFAVVRGKEASGVCKKCLNLVELAEENASEGLDGEELDFEDPDTFECRFKEYWDVIKEEEHLTLNDVYFPNSKREQEGDSNSEDIEFRQSILGKRRPAAEFEELTKDNPYSKGEKGKDRNDECIQFQAFVLKKRKSEANFNNLILDNDSSPDFKGESESEAEFEGWGSKPLIKFLKLIGKETTTPLPQHRVVCDIYDYIIDRHLFVEISDKKIMVSCDYWLYRVFEMENLDVFKIFSLLEAHMENGVSEDIVDEMTWKCLFERKLERKLKKRKEDMAMKDYSPIEERMFASIVASNLKCVYIRRSLVEDMMSKEPDSWETKVVGSFVRVEVDPNDKQAYSSHELTQVKGIIRINNNKERINYILPPELWDHFQFHTSVSKFCIHIPQVSSD